ncbi:hypothetical protein [Bacillus sp. FJAT-28004]|uniref:hypothetical protein n=1 Tax=Bacillus sp. FJAT-28004 TaxID=1679165 RepID=UPI0006B5D254|nr:hypothetical protein [Bacillus sp. FJAT-28004]
MKIIHFYPRSSGINFLRLFRSFLVETYEEQYVHYDKSENLLIELADRINNTDIVIFTAHGTEEYVIGDSVRGQVVQLDKDKLVNLRNSFVFAFSCSTGNLGKELCLDHNVLSYVGFDDVIDLVVKSSIAAYRDELSKLLKHIYNDALQASFKQFAQKNCNVTQFELLISLNLKRSFSKVLSMRASELSRQFSISLVVANSTVFMKKLHSDLLTTIDSVRSRIVVHGEREFIPWTFVGNDHVRIGSLIHDLENCVYSDSNEYYRLFMLAYLYYKLNRKTLAFNYYMKSKELYPEYEPLKLLSFEGQIFKKEKNA